MLSTKTIKRKIRSANNIAKVTQAMEMVAASKMTKAQLAALAGRPYAERLFAVTQHLTGSPDLNQNPLLQKPSTTGQDVTIVVAPEKGLCGGLVTNLERRLHDKSGLFISVGSKARQIIRHGYQSLFADFLLGLSQPAFAVSLPIVQLISENFLNHNFRRVTVVYTHFINTLKQVPVEKVLLPIETPAEGEKEKKIFAQYLFEPSPGQLLEALLSHYLEIELYQILLEAYASEQSARMVSMKNATENAKGLIDELTLFYNKARQQEITSEIADLVKAQ